MQIVGLAGRAAILRENARGLQMDTDDIVPSKEAILAMQAQQAAAAAQPQPQGNPGASQAPQPSVNAAPPGAVAQPQ
jgi:hypothetical protein